MNCPLSSATMAETELVPSPSAQPWQELFNAYRHAVLGPAGAQGRNTALVFDRLAFDDIRNQVLRRTQGSICNDVLVVEVQLAGRDYDRARERLADVLFCAGYEVPLVWASRDILLKESRRGPLLSRLLPSQALGFAPALGLPEIARIAQERGRLVAVGVRGKQRLPHERDWRISVVLPAFNEVKTIDVVLQKILEKNIAGAKIEICIVESNSSDGTREKVLAYKDNPNVNVILEDRPRGKGHAVRTGLRAASGDIVIIQDADLEYDINDYEKLLVPIRAYESSFVLGSRHHAGESVWEIRSFEGQQNIARILNFGHIFFTWFLNLMFRQRLRDPFTMFKVFRRDAIQTMRLECNRFDFDHELVGKLVRAGRLPMEINVSYLSRSFDEGKKVAFFRDPPTWIKACIKHRFSELYQFPATR
jgi:Glycosyl transferase family 2